MALGVRSLAIGYGSCPVSLPGVTWQELFVTLGYFLCAKALNCM